MKTYLEVEEVQKLEKQARYLRDKLLIRLTFRLGCRISEALNIAVEDIDFKAGAVTIQHLKQRLQRNCPECKARLSKTAGFCPSCGIRIEQAALSTKEQPHLRTLPVDRDTLALLKEYRDGGGAVQRNGRELLFGFTRTHAWYIVTDLAWRAGLGKLVNPTTGKERQISPHRLRDSFAVHAVKTNDSGDGLRLLQEHLGHQSIETTMRYRKISGQEHRDWYNALWEKG